MVTFVRALEVLASGGAIRRATWPTQNFVVRRGEALEYLFRDEQYELTHADIMSDDWHVCTIPERSS